MKNSMRKNMNKSTLNSNNNSVDEIEIREQHYEKYLGKLDQPIMHSTDIHEKPHIDIYQIPPTPKRPAWTLITGGMSDVKQNIPLHDKRTSGRTELLMLVQNPQDWMFGLLKELALMPFEDNNLLHWGHLYRLNINCSYAQKYGATHLLFMPPLFENERFYNTLHINGSKVDPLWVVPITEQEFEQCQQESGVLALMGNIMQINRPRIFESV